MARFCACVSQALTKMVGGFAYKDLFFSEVLEHKINEKSFSRADSYDINAYYGKENFFKYVADNYKNIDFSRFRPFLHFLTTVIKTYNPENSLNEHSLPEGVAAGLNSNFSLCI